MAMVVPSGNSMTRSTRPYSPASCSVVILALARCDALPRYALMDSRTADERSIRNAAHFNKPAAQLNPQEAARLAVMLPSPRFFETRQGSAYLARRTSTIVARMGSVQLP